MGDTKLFVLLLFYAIVVTDAQEDEAVCLLAKRYKSLHKYEYLYEAESLNTLNGAINGPKVSCKVEIEVPGTCNFIVHTKECTLSEVINADADGNPVFGPTAGAETFKAQMEKNPLKVVVEGDNDIKLFPEDDELINILNIKRGIISALAVPVLQEEKNKKMPTIYGLCKTDYTVNTREDIATDVTLNRDLSRCDQFKPIRDHTSHLAIITDMHYPLAQLIRSKQTCSYKFDNEQKHMTSGACTEDHLFVPFSYKGRHGVSSVGKQTLSLLGVTEHNERVFDHNNANMKTLYLDESVDMSPNQDENAILAVLRELSGLSSTANGQKRAHLAYKLVALTRKMNADTLSAALPEALEISPSLTFQALFQCGTPECSSAILQFHRKLESSSSEKSSEIDAVAYLMGMMPDPSRALVKEMLEVAKIKPSKLIYYATSNTVRRLYKSERRATPEIKAVADYALENIGDCTGDQEHIYLTLRVIGNMAEAMGAASPALMSAVIQCINQPAASTEVQQAAIQVFRLTPIPEEGRTVLMNVLLDRESPVQKRIAAYLIMMKDPQPAELAQLAAALPNEENLQVKSFVISHLTNILKSNAQETNELRVKIVNAFQDNEVGNLMDATKFSRNYVIGSLEGNMIFDKENNLPTEVMLEMTLNAFGYDIDMVEVGMEGKGLEPTVEALFGPNGFFPDTVMKTIYYAADKMPPQVNEVLKTIIPALNDRKKVPKNIIREIGRNVDKLIKNLNAQDAPEAMFYLRLLGTELGYLKTKDIEEMAFSVTKVAENFMKTFPALYSKSLLSSADNELFLHYIFMDNEFYLPTGPGLPLRVAVAGTFTPGVKGGLRISPDMREIAFMPSAGVEFVTEIGAHFPDYVQSGLEMHTNIYHESGIKAKVAMTYNQIKLTIPAPENPVKLLSMSNSIVSVTGDQTKTIPAMGEHVGVNKCTPFFPGVNYCYALQYADAMNHDASPYFPLSGDSKFAIELHSTADVSEYTATINYANEENTDTVTFNVKAEGTTFEATSKVMFNRKEYTVSTDLQIPDYDIEAGIRIGPADASTTDKATHSIQIDFINKNIPQASLVGLAKIKAMKDALLQVQLLVPSLETNAKLTASLKRAEKLILELESDLKVFDASSVQKLTLKYDHEAVEAQIMSDVNSKTQNIVSTIDNIKEDIKMFLDQNIGQTKTKVCDVLASSIEATNSYLAASEIPYVQNLRVPSLSDFEVPETLFLNIEAGAKYNFGKHYYTISLPMPLGGKSSSKDLNFPPALTTPNLAVPQLGLNIASIKVPLPEVFVPKTLTLSLPTLGKAEVVGKLSSNLYNLEASASAGRDSDEHQTYSARFGVVGSGPVDLLSLNAEGSAMIIGIMTDTIKAEMNSVFNHKLIAAKINIKEELQLKEKISIRSNSKLEATSPFNVQFSLEHTGQVGVNTEGISGENILKGSFVSGPIDGDVTLTQSLDLFPFKPEARIDSNFEITSTPFQAKNKIVASFVNGELSVVSNSAAFDDMLTHNAEVILMRWKCDLKSETNALGMRIHNTAEAIYDEDLSIKVETKTTNSEDYINSLIVANLNMNGLAVSSDASVKIADHTATHKASLNLDKNGLVTSGTTSVNSLLTLTNTFSGILHSSKFSLSSESKGNFKGIAIDNTNSISATIFSLDLASKSRVDFAEDMWYIYDISVHAEPYTATAGVTSQLKLAHETEMKNSCEIKLADLTGNVKCSTTGKLIGAHMNHDIEMEIVGLGVRINNDARFNSKYIRFSTVLQATAAPFTFNLHALANGDGEVYLFAKHSAQVYTKVLLKAEPLAFAHSHECRFSTSHEFDKNIILEANFENKVETQLSLDEQSSTVTVQSKINSDAFNHALRAYNNHEKIGLEVSGGVTFRESQDFSVSAVIQYDKNTENHIMDLSFLESLPAVLENFKMSYVAFLEALLDYIKKEEFGDKIQTLLENIADTVAQLHLEENINQLKGNLIALAQACPITQEDLEAAVNKLRSVTLSVMAELSTHANDVQEMIFSGTLSDTLVQKLTSFNEEYDIRSMLLAVIEAIENVIQQIDLTKLEDSNIPVFNDAEKLNAVKLNLQHYVTDLKNAVTDFDKAQFVEQMQNIISTTEMYTEQIRSRFSREDISKIVDTLKQLLTELDIIGRCKSIYSSVRDFVIKFELDKRTEEFFDKLLELLRQFNVDKTIQVLVNALKSIQFSFQHMLDNALSYLKTTDIKDIIEDLNKLIEDFLNALKSFEYNTFVDGVNQKLSEYTDALNTIIVSLELPQKLEATREFINYALTSMSAFLEQLKSAKLSDVIKPVKKLIDTLVLNDMKRIAEKFKQDIMDMDIRGELLQALQQVREIYSKVLVVLTNAFDEYVEVATRVLGDQQIVSELKQIIDNVVNALKTSEIEIPSFTVPLTDLVLPSWKFSLQQLHEADIPVQFYLPQFTILGSYTVPEITITYDDIKQILINIADFIINFKIKIFPNNFSIGKLKLNLPDFSAFTLPAVTLPQISLPAIPKLNDNYMIDIPLQIPELKLPKIPNSVVLPALGKLQGRIKINSPIYTFRVIADVRNSTDSGQMHQFVALIKSVGESSSFSILNYELDTTVRIGLPKMSRLILAETCKFIHSAVSLEHQASVTLYGLSAQASAQTNVKVTTAPYTAEILSKAFIAVEGGMSASFDTTYKHLVNIPCLSLSNKATLTQSTIALQKDGTIRLTVANVGTGAFALSGFSDEGTHKSDLICAIAPKGVRLTFTGDTDSATLKVKETMNLEAATFSHINFNGRIETQSPFIKNSVIVASGSAHLGKMMAELAATHDTELTGSVSGTLSNVVNIKVHPVEIVVDIQNKGNGKVNHQESLSTKFDLQNYYALILNSNKQHINTAALMRFSQHKYSYNFTIDNNDAETGFYTAVNGETDLEFLTVPISIPEIVIPVMDLTIPAINDVNLYEISGLKHLQITKPTVDVNTKIVYQKSRLAPIIDLGFIRVPAVGNLISEMSFKSSIFNLITNAGIYGDNDLVIRIAATSTSEYEELKANLEGTSSLTLKRGFKLANALSLKYAYIEGNHNSTLTLNTENLEAVVAVATVASMNLPILGIDVNHKLLADTKTLPNAASTLIVKHKFDLPIIKAVGTGEAEHILKIGAAASYITIESTTKSTIDGTFLETGIVKGALANEAFMHMAVEGLRSKLTTIGDINVNRGDLKVKFDVNENIEMESALNRVYSIMNIVSNNEVNIATFNTKGKHAAKATVDFAPLSSLVADVEFDLAQPTTLGDFTIYEKTIVDLNLFKQKINYNTKMVSPVYTQNIVLEMEGDAPFFKFVFKSSSKSPVVLLEYDLDSYLITAVENEGLNVRAKAFLQHDDFTMDFNSIFTPSVPTHSVNVDITSPTFTDVILRYAAQRKDLTASISSPSAGFLGFHLQGKIPSQLTSRLYGRYASSPENEIDILKVNVAINEDEKIHFQADCNLETPQEMTLGLKQRLPLITSAVTNFAEKYGILSVINGLRTTLVSASTEAYAVSLNYVPELSQLSVLYRNVVVRHQKAIQHLLNTAVTFLRETQIKLPGMKEATLPEICQQIKSSIATVFEEIINAIAENLKSHILPTVKTIRISLPHGEILTGDEILGHIENTLTHCVNMVKNMDSLDVILENLGQALQKVVEKTEEYIDTIQSDFLDKIAEATNVLYTNAVALVNSMIYYINYFLNADSQNALADRCMEWILSMVKEFENMVYVGFPSDPFYKIHIQNGMLKMDFTFPFDH